MPATKPASQPSLTTALQCATPSVRNRVLAVLADWPARHGYTRDERNRLIRYCMDRIIKAWGGRLHNPETQDLQALDIECEHGHVWRSSSFKLKHGLWCPECAAGHRRSGLDAMKKLAHRHGGHCISDVYLNVNTMLRWQCRHGHEWEMLPVSVIAGHWCPTCLAGEHARSWLVQMQSLARQHGGKCLSQAYINSRTKLRWQCRQGHIWEATPAVVRIAGAWCPQCASDKRKLTLDDLNGMAVKLGGQCLSTTYSCNTGPLLWRCAEGHEFEQSVAGINKGQWCPVCQRQDKQATGLERMRSLAKKHGGECLSATYEDQESPLRWRCKLGHEWQARPLAIRGGRWCPQCMHASQFVHTIEEMHAIARERGGRCLSDAYISLRERLEWECAHGHTWSTSPMSVLAGHWCRECARQKRHVHSIEEMHDIAHKRGGRCLSDTYVSVSDKLKWECAHGHTWSVPPVAVLSGHWCRKCAHASLRAHTIEEMRDIAHERGGRCLSDTYVSVNARLEWECARGHTWSTLPSTVLAGHWCPECRYLDRSVKDKTRRKYLAVKMPDDI